MAHQQQRGHCPTYRPATQSRCPPPDPCGPPKPGLLWPSDLESPYWKSFKLQDRRKYKRSTYDEKCRTYRSASRLEHFCPVNQITAPRYALRVNKVQCSSSCYKSPTRVRIGMNSDSVPAGITAIELLDGEGQLVAVVTPGNDTVLSVEDQCRLNEAGATIAVFVDDTPCYVYRGVVWDARAISYTLSLGDANNCEEPQR